MEGGDLPVLVDRQNLVVWADVDALSKATVASKGGAPVLNPMAQLPGQGPPQQQQQGAESLAAQRAMVREALRAYHAAGRALYEDAASGVYSQMSKDFPASAISWVKDKATWSGPQQVPLDQVDMSDRDQWDASREPRKVARIAAKMRRGKKPPKPAVLVRWPGSGKDVIVDGHHRILAAQANGEHFVTAYVGHVDSEQGPWLSTAAREKGRKAA